jgi:alkylation response protein AidB-like acyl-CoA dehydrogenase
MYAAKTRAVRDGDDWIINGQKVFTTAAHVSDYVLLLTRTDPDVPKHKGLTMFLVPLTLPGIEIQALHTMQEERTNITYYADVRVPDMYRLGPVGGAIGVMAAAMRFEHSGEGYHISIPPSSRRRLPGRAMRSVTMAARASKTPTYAPASLAPR